MIKTFIVASIFIFLTPIIAPAEIIQTCVASGNCELSLFKEISGLFRGPREETAITKYILSLAQDAQKEVWRDTLVIESDPMGNIVIRVPATGKFKDSATKSVAIQAHVDMVLAYADAKPGEDIRKYFANGVKLETVDGWLQSQGRKTTLGADNGVGVAYALRYLIDPNLIHPPLELIFTVQEEVGLKGALGLKIPIQSQRLISLDGMSPAADTIITSSQGSFGTHIKSNSVPGVALSKDVNYFQVVLTGLAGGHSGNDIHKKRMNALKGLAETYQQMKTKIPGLQIHSLLAGDTKVLNKIPNLYTVTYTTKKSVTLKKFETEYKRIVAKFLKRLPDENKDALVVIKQLDPQDVKTLMLPKKVSEAIVKSIIKAPNGVVEVDKNYPEGVKTSSNLSYISVNGDAGNKNLTWSMGFFSRSFLPKGLSDISDKVKKTLVAPILEFGPVAEDIQSTYPPWNALPNSPMQKYVFDKHSKYFSKTAKFPAGIEPSVFQKMYPDMDILVIGPYILEAHTVNERLNLESLTTIATALKEILENMP